MSLQQGTKKPDDVTWAQYWAAMVVAICASIAMYLSCRGYPSNGPIYILAIGLPSVLIISAILGRRS